MQIIYFESASAFRAWLAANHDRTAELWVGFYRKDSGKTGITYAEAVDEALCFGWIDGLKKRVNAESYTHRFTPRKPKSNWSLNNIRRAGELKCLGRMTPAGLKAFEARDPRRSGVYSFENTSRRFDFERKRKFRRNRRAWEFFRNQPPGYQRLAKFWVMSARREATRCRRLARLMDGSEKGLRLGLLTGTAKDTAAKGFRRGATR